MEIVQIAFYVVLTLLVTAALLRVIGFAVGLDTANTSCKTVGELFDFTVLLPFGFRLSHVICDFVMPGS